MVAGEDGLTGVRVRRFGSRVVAAAAVVGLLAGVGTVAVTNGNDNSGQASAASSVLYVPPNCDPTVDACQAAKVAALEQWAVAQGGIAPSPSPSPTPTSQSPTPTSQSPTPTSQSPSPTATPTPTPTPTPTVTPPPTTGKALLGMSAPLNLWDARVREVGPGLQARRLFFSGFGDNLAKAADTCADGMYPVMSFKTGTSYSWADVAAGRADTALRDLAVRLNALPCPVFVGIHHEPASDGTAADYAAMQTHALPILGGPAGGRVQVGPIANGWWWSAAARGYSDAEIKAWLTTGVLAVSDVVAADVYQVNAGGEENSLKMTRMVAWANRVGWSKGLGLGEFNAQSASAITDATAQLAKPPWVWGCLWNADGNTATVLTGDRLAAFRSALASW